MDGHDWIPGDVGNTTKPGLWVCSKCGNFIQSKDGIPQPGQVIWYPQPMYNGEHTRMVEMSCEEWAISQILDEK